MKKHFGPRRILVMNVNVDTNEYISNIKQLVDDGHDVVITVVGYSMTPFLRNQRDRVLLKKPSWSLNVGDIVFYQRKTGQYVLHRIYKNNPDGYYMMGDHLYDLEGPIESNAIFAVVTEIERNGRWISAETFSWKTASSLWRMLHPVRKLAYSVRRTLHR